MVKYDGMKLLSDLKNETILANSKYYPSAKAPIIKWSVIYFKIADGELFLTKDYLYLTGFLCLNLPFACGFT